MGANDAPELPYANGDFLGYELLLNEEERQHLEKVKDFLREEVRPVVTDYWNRDEFPHELIPGIAGLGLVSPVENGRSHLLSGMVSMELTRADSSIATFMGVHDGLFTGTIQACASEEQKAKWLPQFLSMEKIGAFGLTEPDHGSDVAGGIETTAEKQGDTWILNGQKRWIGNSTWSDYVVIWAKDTADGQVKCFLVDTSWEGYSVEKIENKIALRIVQNGHITLENVKVPEEHRLANANSFKDTNRVLKATRASVGWQAVGQQMAAFDVARAYAVKRKQFGKPLAAFQLIQEQLVTILGNAQASMGMMVRVAQLEDAGLAKDEHSALAKAFTTKLMRESVAIARSIFGGNGIVTDYEIAKIFADAEAIYSYEGTYEVNTLVTGRSITGVSAFV